MKKIIIILLFLNYSCSNLRSTKHIEVRIPASSSENAPADSFNAKEFETFQANVEEALTWRSKAIAFYENNKEKFDDKNFTHQDLEAIYASTKYYVSIRNKLLKVIEKYKAHFDDLGTINYSLDKNTDMQGLIKTINPNDEEGKEILKNMKMAFSAGLVLYDNYLSGIYPYANHRKTRKLINQDIPELHNLLNEITDNFFDIKQRAVMMRVQSLAKQDIKQEGRMFGEQEKYLHLLIQQSPFYNFLDKKFIDLKNQNAITTYIKRTVDRFTFLNDSFTFITSKNFGNTVGLVAFRDGLLTKLSNTEKEKLTKQLKPLDIFLEKTPFRLTDKFIPGYYGHVAIWIGNESELKELGIWDHPTIRPYQEAIKSGHHVIEALRPGVQINTLKHFLNIDDLLVLRDKELTTDQKKEFIVRAFSQIGKEYDFNFDVETDSKIVCSEIVYVVFHDINWPTEKQLGRYTISPDNVANKAIDGRLDIVLIFKDGKEIQGDLFNTLKENLSSK